MKTQYPTHYANYAGKGRSFTDGGKFESDAAAVASAVSRKVVKSVRLVSVHNASGVVVFRA